MKLPAQRRYLLLLCLLCVGLLLAACGGDDESAAEPTAAAASSSAGPLKFVYFRSDDCGTQCAEMDPIIDGFVETYKDKLVVEKQDGKSEAGKKLMDQFSLTKIPSYLILDSNGNKLWSNSGPIHKDMLGQQIINLTK